MSFFKNLEISKIVDNNEAPKSNEILIDGVCLHKETASVMNKTKQDVHKTID